MKTTIYKVHPEFPDAGVIAQCVKVIRQGGLVIFPTETVYGIAADASNPKAIQRLREVKQRSDDKKFSVIISQKGLISNYTRMNDAFLYKMIDCYWPGPLTVVVPTLDEQSTVGVRMPDNLIAINLTRECQCPVAAPSANIEGRPAPKTCQEALKDLDGLVEIALDGGPVEIGQGSSVVDLSVKPAKVLREGPITQADVDQIAHQKNILFVCTGNSCRSVMAHYFFRSLMAARSDVVVDSAGTGVFMHSRASGQTIEVLREDGIDATDHQSQPINTILLKKADLIIVMTRSHRQQVLERVPSVEKRVYLLREFTNVPASFHSDLDIPDPIGQPHHAYRECFAVIREAVMKLSELI